MGALKEAFGIPPIYAAAFLGITCFATIFGGLQRISRVMERVVPFMALLYILGGLAILLQHWQEVPGALALILRSAFSPVAAAGGFAGATMKDAMRYGIARGLYSNEAGIGSAPNASASANVSHPVKQGLVQMLSVFIDTLLLCTATAMMCMSSVTVRS